MKTVSVRDLQRRIKGCIDEAQEDRVVITRHGRPAAVLFGIEGEDWEVVLRQTSAPFWELIRKRREQPTLSFEELTAAMGQKDTGWRQIPVRKKKR